MHVVAGRPQLQPQELRFAVPLVGLSGSVRVPSGRAALINPCADSLYFIERRCVDVRAQSRYVVCSQNMRAVKEIDLRLSYFSA